MRFQFKTKKLEALYTEEKNAHKYPSEVIDNFFEVMEILDAIPNEIALYQYKGIRFEKLKGKRGKLQQRSIRLNQQWRLILTIEKDEEGNFISLIDIEDYH
jgi:proteic killer suppression protein